MEIDQNRIMQKLSAKMNSIVENDLSNETSSKFEEMNESGNENEFYLFALKELSENYNKYEFELMIENEYNEAEEDDFYNSLEYSHALHKACDKFLATQFYY